MSTDKLRIYHNSRCSKSRSACALLTERGVTAEVVEYLKTPPSREELAELVRMLGVRPGDLLRKGEAVFKERYAGRELSDEECLDAMVAHPVLIERPIVVRGSRAVVGRPPEKVLELLD